MGQLTAGAPAASLSRQQIKVTSLPKLKLATGVSLVQDCVDTAGSNDPVTVTDEVAVREHVPA